MIIIASCSRIPTQPVYDLKVPLKNRTNSTGTIIRDSGGNVHTYTQLWALARPTGTHNCTVQGKAASGAVSDHRCVYTAAIFPKSRNFQRVSQWRRTRDRDREAAFASNLQAHDWSDLTGGVDIMTARLRKVIGELTDRHFPLERVRKRSNEFPWITRKIGGCGKEKFDFTRKVVERKPGGILTGTCKPDLERRGAPLSTACWKRAPGGRASMLWRRDLPQRLRPTNGPLAIYSPAKNQMKSARRCLTSMVPSQMSTPTRSLTSRGLVRNLAT